MATVNSVVGEKALAKALSYHLFKLNQILAFNVFLLGRPWEADCVRIFPSGNWVEYEIKCTLADFKADFGKGRRKRNKDGEFEIVGKHDLLSGQELELQYCRHRPMPSPKQFYFVCPVGVIPLCQVPPHAGLIEVAPGNNPWNCGVTKKAPRLKGVPLDHEAMFNIFVKLGAKHVQQMRNTAWVS